MDLIKYQKKYLVKKNFRRQNMKPENYKAMKIILYEQTLYEFSFFIKHCLTGLSSIFYNYDKKYNQIN